MISFWCNKIFLILFSTEYFDYLYLIRFRLEMLSCREPDYILGQLLDIQVSQPCYLVFLSHFYRIGKSSFDMVHLYHHKLSTQQSTQFQSNLIAKFRKNNQFLVNEYFSLSKRQYSYLSVIIMPLVIENIFIKDGTPGIDGIFVAPIMSFACHVKIINWFVRRWPRQSYATPTSVRDRKIWKIARNMCRRHHTKINQS